MHGSVSGSEMALHAIHLQKRFFFQQTPAVANPCSSRQSPPCNKRCMAPSSTISAIRLCAMKVYNAESASAVQCSYVNHTPKRKAVEHRRAEVDACGKHFVGLESRSWGSWKRDGRGSRMALMSLKEGSMGKVWNHGLAACLRRIAPFVRNDHLLPRR